MTASIAHARECSRGPDDSGFYSRPGVFVGHRRLSIVDVAGGLIVEFAARVPDHLKIRGGVAKYILKKAVQDLLPHDIICRKKMGFPTPLRSWFLDERAKPLFSLLLGSQGLLASYLDRGAIGVLIERRRNGIVDATDRIWRLLNLQIWGDLYFNGKSNHLNGKSNRGWEGLLSRASVAS